MFLFKRALLHHSAHLPIPDLLPTRIGVSIGLGSTVIFAAVQLARPFAVRDPEED
jgi:hypothetical protein